MKKIQTAMMRIYKLKNKDNGLIVYGLKHPSEYTWLVPNEDSYYELTQREIDDMYETLEGTPVTDIQNVLKLAFNKAMK